MGNYGWDGSYSWESGDHENVYADKPKQESERRNSLKKIAEERYAAAITLKRKGDFSAARNRAINAVRLYEELNIQTLEDAAPTRMRVNGIELPDIMHQDVVRERLGIK